MALLHGKVLLACVMLGATSMEKSGTKVFCTVTLNGVGGPGCLLVMVKL